MCVCGCGCGWGGGVEGNPDTVRVRRGGGREGREGRRWARIG